jgi:PKD repeat protein
MFLLARPFRHYGGASKSQAIWTVGGLLGLIAVIFACLCLAPRPAVAGSGQQELTASLTASPTTVSVGQAVSFFFALHSNGGPDVGIPLVNVDFGDGSSIDGGIGGPGAQPIGWPSHSYDTPGTYTARLDGATSDGATASSSVTITVLAAPSTPPNISLKANPASPSLGQPVNFDYAVPGLPDSGGSMQLNFGDGTSAQLSGTSGSASHSYAHDGAYPAILVVTDQSGQILGAGSTTVQVGG